MSTETFDETVERNKAALAAFISPEGVIEIDLEKCKADRAAFIAKAEKVMFVAIGGMFAFGFVQFGLPPAVVQLFEYAAQLVA